MEAFINWLEKHMLSCPYKVITSIDCPGCGIQRSFVFLLKGDLAGSFSLYPALLPVIFTLILTAAHLLFRFKKGPESIKFSFFITTGIIVISYIFKICS
jgi:hypothetical protein